jgi:hypothetical protein
MPEDREQVELELALRAFVSGALAIGGSGVAAEDPPPLADSHAAGESHPFADMARDGGAHGVHDGRTYATGGYEEKPELYFTLWEKDGHYGPVIVRDNIFVLGPNCGSPAVTFVPGGDDVVFSGNRFRAEKTAVIRVDPSCEKAEVQVAPMDFNHLWRAGLCA